jgi:hypothetical protein
MKFLSDILAKAGLTVDGVVTLNNTATGQTPDANDNSTKLATTAWVRTFVQPYSLPIASASILGGIKVGTGLSIDSGTGILSVTGASASSLKSTQTFVVTEGQTVFTVTNGYSPGLIDIFLNGVYLSPNQSTATNGSTFTLNDAPATGDIIDVIVVSPVYQGTSTTTDQLPEGVVNLYYTNARARAAITLTVNGSSGASTYSSSTGVLNVPTYTLAGLGGIGGSGTTGYVSKFTNSTTIGNSLIYDNGFGIGINTSSPYNSSFYSLDVNGALLVKNVGKTANITLINSDPAGGGNNAFVIHTVGGTFGDSYVDIQGYYGASITGSTTIRLNAAGGNILIGSLIGTGTRMVVASSTGILSAQAIPTISDLSGVPTSRTLTINGVTYDLTANRSWSALPVGGTAGQLLAKVDGTDYNAQWINEAPAASYTSQVKHQVKSAQVITKGQAVYVSSADGTNMIVSKASNATEGTSSKTMGLLESTVSTNGFTNVIAEGLLSGLDTTGANAAGDPVWLGTDGNLIYGLTNKPSAPAHLVFIGVVTRRNANNGEIFVKVQNGFEMNELHDYVESGVQNNFVISYESSTDLYKPKSIATLLGYTPANAARNLTINGTTFDLTADRTWTLTTSVIGEGTNLYYTDARVGTYLTNNSYATQTYVNTAVSNLVDAAPGTLDTLNELAAALGDDPNFATTVATSIGTKQAQLNGTGFVKVSGTTVSYDNSTYYLASNPNGYITGISFANVSAKPTTIAGYGITDSLVYTTSTYSNPSWLTALAWSKITGAPAFITGYTETDTLASVTSRGSSTTGGITINGTATITTDISLTRSDTPPALVFTSQNGLRWVYSGGGNYWTTTLSIDSNNLINMAGSPLATRGWVTSQGYITGYTETDTLATVTGRGATTSTETTYYGGLRTRKSQTAGNYTTAALWTESYDNTATGIAFHISGVKGTFLEMRTNHVLYWDGNTIYHSGNLTNLNQLTNGPGYITGYTETDTLASVTARGASTSSSIIMSGGSGTTATLMLDRNIATPSNYYSGLQFEVRATSGTAGIGLHRNGYSHVGIYHDSTNELKFNMNAGTVIVPAAAGTLWGSGNLTNLNQLSNGPGYITASYGGFATRQDGNRYTTNYNSILSSGFFNGESTPTNAPNAYGQLIVAKGVDTGLQIAGGYNSNNLYFRGWGYGPEADGFYPWRTVWHSGNLTNLNQLTNGPGYITGYTETDTLASVTGRGASTSSAITVNNKIEVSRNGAYGGYVDADLIVGHGGNDRRGYGQTGGSNIMLRSSSKNTITALDESNNLGQISYENLVWTIGEDIGWGVQRVDFPGTANMLGTLRLPNNALISVNNEPDTWGARFRTTVSTTNLGAGLKNIIFCGGGSNEGFAVTGVGTGTTAFEVRNDGRAWIKGDLTVQSNMYVSADGSSGYVASRIWLYSHNNYRGAGIYMSGTGSTWFAGTGYTDFDGAYIISRRSVAGDDSTAWSNYRLWQVNSGGSTYQTGELSAVNVHAYAATGRVVAGTWNFDGMLFDSSRSALIARGNYPHIELWSDVSNSNHGGTLRFSGYDNGSSGAYKSWNIGAPGSDLYFLDIGYGGSSNSNPHAGIAGLGAAYSYPGAFTIMRFHNNGNIGIGNFGTYGSLGDNTPSFKLDVRGTLRATTHLVTPLIYSGGGNVSFGNLVSSQSGYVSVSNPWGTSDSAFFPNGITTAGGTNWIYGLTYLGNAPSNGSGAEVRANGSSYFRSSNTGGTWGYAGQFVDRNNAANNYVPWSFENEWGNHSWGIVARFHIQTAGQDKPAIQFTSAGSNERWSIGYCTGSDFNFRITQNQGYRTDNSTNDGWGTQRFMIDTSGTLWANGVLNLGPDSGADNGLSVRYGGGGYGRIRFYSDGSNHQTIHAFGTGWTGGGVAYSNNSININGGSGVTFGAWNVPDGYVATGGSAWFRYDVTAYSDARVKTDIINIDNAVSKIQSINGVTFTRTDKEDGKRYAGVIAQEVLNVLPEVVSQNEDGMYSVSYGNMAGLFIEAIKEQQAQIESQKTEIEELKDLVKQLINR